MIAAAVIIALATVLYFFLRKDQKDAAKTEGLQKTLEQVGKANAPATKPELDSVQQQYRRD